MYEALQLHEDSWRCEGVFCVCSFSGRGFYGFPEIPLKDVGLPSPFKKKKRIKRNLQLVHEACMYPDIPWSALHGDRIQANRNVCAALRAESWC